EKYFQALEYLFNVYDHDKSFLAKYDSISDNLISREWLCPLNKVLSQIDCFKFIPVLHYVNRLLEEKREISNQNIFRLFRYLSNLTNDKTITKTINKQVINAIKLVDNLVREFDDIACIINLEKGLISKTLLTPEEHFKFSIYQDGQNREITESAFWMAEDNNILKGKISPLIQFSYFVNKPNDFEHSKSFDALNSVSFDLNRFKQLFLNFQKLTSEDNEKLSDNIWGSLFLTDYYQVKDYNEKHKIIVCKNSDDFHLIRDKKFLLKLIEVENFNTCEDYFQSIFNEFISNYSTLNDLKNEVDFKNQLYAYYVVLKNLNNWHLGKGKNFGVYLSPSMFNSFFELNIRFQHYRQKWQGADYNYFDDIKNQLTMSYEYSEDQLIEQATEDVLKELGWQVVTAWQNEFFGEEGLLGRDNKTEVVLERHLLAALKRYNPDLPDLAYKRAIEKIVQKEAGKNLAQQNKAKYQLLKNGVEVSFTNAQGKTEKKTLRVFDYKNYTNNEFLAVRQLEVSGELYNRRPDVVGFVNGIPLVFIELKSHAVDLRSAYEDNFKDYKDTIPHLFHHNAFVILSNGMDSKVGTVTSPY